MKRASSIDDDTASCTSSTAVVRPFVSPLRRERNRGFVGRGGHVGVCLCETLNKVRLNTRAWWIGEAEGGFNALRGHAVRCVFGATNLAFKHGIVFHFVI